MRSLKIAGGYVVFAACAAAAAFAAQKEARVTQVIREVNVLEKKADPRRATVNEQVREGQAVKTGDESRSELTFPDVTIERLGANTLFTFNNGGRDVQLNSGSMLLRVPKASGGANIRTSAVTVAITGTTLILETGGGGRSKLILLEGNARLALRKNAQQSRRVAAGQMLDVPAGATTLPEPVDIDLNSVMRTHPLIVGFPPLPSYPLIVAAANNARREPVYQGQPVGGGTFFPPGGGGRRPPVVVANPPPASTGGGNTDGGSGTGTGGGRKPGGGSGSSGVKTPPIVTTQPSTPTPAPIGRTLPSAGRVRSGRSTPPPIR